MRAHRLEITDDDSEVSAKKYQNLFSSWGSFGDVIPLCDGGPIGASHNSNNNKDSDDEEYSNLKFGDDDFTSCNPQDLVPFLTSDTPPKLMFQRNLLAKQPCLFAVTPTLPVVCPLTGDRHSSAFLTVRGGALKPFCCLWDDMVNTIDELYQSRRGALIEKGQTFQAPGLSRNWHKLLEKLEDETIPVSERVVLFENFNDFTIKRRQILDSVRIQKMKKAVQNYNLLEKAEEFAPIDPMSFGGNLHTFCDPRSTEDGRSLILSMSGTNFDQFAILSGVVDNHFVLKTEVIREVPPLGSTIKQLAVQTFSSSDPIIGARTSDGLLHFYSLNFILSYNLKRICGLSSVHDEPVSYSSVDLSSYVPGECLAATENRELYHYNIAEDADRFINRISLPECRHGCCRSVAARRNSYPFRVHFGDHPRQYVATENHTMWLGDLRESGRSPLLLFEPRSCSDMETFGTIPFYESVASDTYFSELFACELGPGPNCHTVSTETNLLIIDQRMPRRIVQNWGHLLQSPAAYLSVSKIPQQSPDWLILAGTQFSDEVLACPLLIQQSHAERPVSWDLPWRIPNIGSVDRQLPTGEISAPLLKSCLHEVPLAGLSLLQQRGDPDLLTVLQLSSQCHLFYQVYSTREESDDFDLGQGNSGRVTSPLDTMMESIPTLSMLGKMCQKWAKDVSLESDSIPSISSPSVSKDTPAVVQTNVAEDEEAEAKLPRPKFKLFQERASQNDEPNEDDDLDLFRLEEVTFPSGPSTFCSNCRPDYASRHFSRGSPELETLTCDVCDVSLGDSRQAASMELDDKSRTFVMSTQSYELEEAFEGLSSHLPTGDSLAKFTDSFSKVQQLILQSPSSSSETALFESDEYQAAMEARVPWARRHLANIVDKAFNKIKNPRAASYLANSSIIDSSDAMTTSSLGGSAINYWSGGDPDLMEKLMDGLSVMQQQQQHSNEDDDDDLEDKIDNLNEVENDSESDNNDDDDEVGND